MRNAQTIQQSLAYWTEVAIATYEVAASKKKTSQYELKRLHGIAENMVIDCKTFGVTEDDCKHNGCGRVIVAMKEGVE